MANVKTRRVIGGTSWHILRNQAGFANKRDAQRRTKELRKGPGRFRIFKHPDGRHYIYMH